MVGHGEKLHDVPDEYLEDSLIVAKKIAVASGLENYNILQVRVHPPPASRPANVPRPIRITGRSLTR